MRRRFCPALLDRYRYHGSLLLWRLRSDPTQRITFCAGPRLKRAYPLDDFARSTAVADHAQERAARLVEVGDFAVEETQARLSVRGDRCQRLIDFMRDRCSNLTDGSDLRRSRQFNLSQPQGLFDILTIIDIDQQTVPHSGTSVRSPTQLTGHMKPAVHAVRPT